MDRSQRVPQEKKHWYDGWFYDRLIAPNQDVLFAHIRRHIPPEATVLDIGTGTGRLAFQLAARGNAVHAIDLSLRNVERALSRLLRDPHPTLSIEHAGVDVLLERGIPKFHFAVLTFVLHEIPSAERRHVLEVAARLAETVLVGEYRVPFPGGFDGALTRVVEFVAGREHFTNFKDFIAAGGVPGLIKALPLHIDHEVQRLPNTGSLYVLKPRPGTT